MKIEHIDKLFEVTVIDNDPSPLRDTDTVRVYHGTSDLDSILVAITKGMTGDTWANRRYSYEANNNPKGLFVTPDLKTAKEFGSYVIEFHSKVSDLEAPVWPNGTFTVQGGMAGTFDSEDEREAERIRQRIRWSEPDYEFVAKSDRPELAALLLGGGERQALYRGDLNANSIKAIWVSVDPTRINQKYNRLTPREFLKLSQENQIPTRFGTNRGLDTSSDVAKSSRRKLFKPRDSVSAGDLIDAISKKFKVDYDYVEGLLRDNPDMIRNYVWNDRQFRQVIDDLKR